MEKADTTVTAKLKRQVEYYFSDVNLPRDKFLKNLMDTDKEGFVDLSMIVSFNRMAKMGATVDETAKAIEDSTMLQLSEDRTRVRRCTDILDLAPFDQRAVYVGGFSRDAPPDIDDVRKLFTQFAEVLSVKLRKNSRSEFNGSAFVEFEKGESATAAVEATVRLTENSEEPLTVLSIQTFKEKRKSGEITEDVTKKRKRDSTGDTKPEREYVKGLVLKFEGLGPGVSREDLREIFGQYGVIAWVDFNRDDSDGCIRFAEVGSAAKAKDAIEADPKEIGGKVPKLSVLEHDAEKDFWENVWAQQENKRKRIEEKKKQRKFGPQKRFKKKGRKGKRDRDDPKDGDDDDDDDDDDENEESAPQSKKVKFDSDGEQIEKGDSKEVPEKDAAAKDAAAKDAATKDAAAKDDVPMDDKPQKDVKPDAQEQGTKDAGADTDTTGASAPPKMDTDGAAKGDDAKAPADIKSSSDAGGEATGSAPVGAAVTESAVKESAANSDIAKGAEAATVTGDSAPKTQPPAADVEAGGKPAKGASAEPPSSESAPKAQPPAADGETGKKPAASGDADRENTAPNSNPEKTT